MKGTSNNSESKENQSNYSGILHNSEISDKILNMTADTMFMLSKDGICIDMILHTDRWFLQKASNIIGKNIFKILPSETAIALKKNFDKVVSTGKTSTENYELSISGKNYFFKCIIYLYNEDLILCQYRDITQRVLMKKKLEIMNQKLQEIEKVAQISHWIYNCNSREFQYSGFSGALAVNGETYFISMNEYLEFIHPEDRTHFSDFINDVNLYKENNLIVYRLILNNKVFHFKFKCINTYYENGIKMMNGYVQNISDIMQKKHDLEIVTLAVENSTDYIFSIKTDGQLVFGNRKFKEFNNFNVNEDIIQYNIFEIKRNGSNKTKWLDIIRQLTSTNQTLNFVELHPIPNKPEIIAFDYTSYLVKDSNGDDLIWTFGKDITERVHYEKQVKELNQIMDTVLKNIPMSISVKDVNDNLKYIFSNRIGDEFHWGIKDGMIGKTDFKIFPKAIAEKKRAEDILPTSRITMKAEKLLKILINTGKNKSGTNCGYWLKMKPDPCSSLLNGISPKTNKWNRNL
jgi:hypothetical protein